jgi:mono/diheme cytochrome c family protein
MKQSTLLVLGVLASTASVHADEPVDYLRDVKPIFARHCVICHGPAKQRGDLRLDTAAHAMQGGNSGAAIVPGKSGASRLIQAITGAKDVKAMPPEDRPRLTAAEIAVLRAWTDQGAKAPAKEDAVATAAASTHWAFKAPVRVAPPPVKAEASVRNPIDRFIRARLEKEKITPSPEADRGTLIRRVSLDLLGLPPSPADAAAFVNDPAPDAYDQLVDRLLASPHYGERWARHWLDLARYADSNGFNIDAPRTIWPYRDWVIAALNRDLPFDQFVIEQLAGDLLPGATVAQKVATGFHRNTLLNQEGGIDHEQFRIESIVDRVNTTGAVFLGLTVGCCQCHDHKYDPMSQKEYYQLFAFFNNCDEPNLPLPTPEQTKQLTQHRARVATLQQLVKGLDNATPARQRAWEQSVTLADRDKLPAGLKDIVEKPDYQRTPAEAQALSAYYRYLDQLPAAAAGLGDCLLGGFVGLTTLAEHGHLATYRISVEKQIATLMKKEPAITRTLVLVERATPRETYIHLGGDFLRKGKTVGPGVPSVLHSLAGAGASKTPNRLDLAKWLVDPHNPLTARVVVNRYWQHYFGLGLVETENDFGTQGTPPSHLELLDWLATEFIARGWSMKAMHRLIVTSATYRQASNVRPELANVDPRNRLLARQSRLRLEAEVVRDAALGVSGLLVPKIGGPSVFPPQPDGVFAFTQVQRDWKASAGSDRYRRGLYTYFWRSAPHPALMAFDAPDSTSTCTRRNRSNTPLQALTLLNDRSFYEFAQALALRVLRECPGDDGERVGYAFQLCLARPPSRAEQQRVVALLSRLQESLAADPTEARRLAPSGLPADFPPIQAAAWALVGRVLLNLDEFITRE